MQSLLIDNLKKKFGNEGSGMHSYTIPQRPRYKIVRPTVDMERIETDMQSIYTSSVGILIYLIKHSRPYIGNAVRELPKCMDGVTVAACKEMLTVIKFVLVTKLLCLKMEPKKEEDD